MTAPAVVASRRPVPVDWPTAKRWVRSVIVGVVVVVSTFILLREVHTLKLALASLTHANPIGLALTLLFGATTYLAAAVAITAASGRPLRLGRTTAVQLAAACTNRIAPAGLGGMATNLRYLERSGATTSEAATAIGITSVASFGVHTIATLGVLVIVHRPFGALVPTLPWPALLTGATIAASIGFLVSRRLDSRYKNAVRQGWTTVTSMSADPRRFARLLLGTVGVTLGHGLAFAAAVTACGVRLPIIALFAVFLTGSAIASAAPTPGGLGALEAALVAGLTTLGPAVAPAVAGVLTYRLITYWLPIVPGAVALNLLRRDTLARTAQRQSTEVVNERTLDDEPACEPTTPTRTSRRHRHRSARPLPRNVVPRIRSRKCDGFRLHDPALASEAGHAVTRERIMDECWDEHWHGSTKTLDVHIAHLRAKLGEGAGPERPTIAVLRRVGYRLDTP